MTVGAFYLLRVFAKGKVEELRYTSRRKIMEMMCILIGLNADFEAFVMRNGGVKKKIVWEYDDKQVVFTMVDHEEFDHTKLL